MKRRHLLVAGLGSLAAPSILHAQTKFENRAEDTGEMAE